MPTTSEFRKGLKIELSGEPFIIVEFLHVKPGKGGAFVRTKLRSLLTGNVQEHTFRSGARVESPDIQEKETQYLYNDGDLYYFMDEENYEQIPLSTGQLGDATSYLKEGSPLQISSYKGELVGVELPITVELEVTETEPGFKGDTATGGTKPATLETGLIVQVPLFVNQGDIIKVDTRNATYLERAG